METTEEKVSRYGQLTHAMKVLAADGRKAKQFNTAKGMAWELYNDLSGSGVDVEAPPG